MFTIAPTLSGSFYKPQTTLPENALEIWFNGSNYKVIVPDDIFNAVELSPRRVLQTITSTPFTAAQQFFGIHYNNPLNYRPPVQLKTNLIRLHDMALGSQRITWRGIHTANGVFDWSFSDAVINHLQAQGYDFLYPLHVCPTWAAARPAEAGAYALGSACEPSNMSYWQDFVTAFGTRYAGVIKYYEIWNEPNFTGFFSGTVAQLAQMTRIAATVLKGIDPTIKIVCPALTGFVGGLSSALAYFGNMCNASDGAGGVAKDHYDIIGLHAYAQPSLEYFKRTLVFLPAFLAEVSAQGLGSKPVWNTESGLISPVAKSMAPGKLRYIKQQLLLCLYYGIARWYFYMYDHGTMGVNDIENEVAEFSNWVNWLQGKEISLLNFDSSTNTVYAIIDGQRMVI